MIQAKELMIGNWVSFNDNCDRYGKVIGVNSYDNIHIECDYTPDHSEIKVKGVTLLSDFVNPIPLTPEILEKAGFTILEANTYIIKDPESPHDNYAAVGDYSICCSRDGQWMIMNGCGNTEYIVLYIDYVHELQNWHYLTTGTDLPITFN